MHVVFGKSLLRVMQDTETHTLPAPGLCRGPQCNMYWQKEESPNTEQECLACPSLHPQALASPHSLDYRQNRPLLAPSGVWKKIKPKLYNLKALEYLKWTNRYVVLQSQALELKNKQLLVHCRLFFMASVQFPPRDIRPHHPRCRKSAACQSS